MVVEIAINLTDSEEFLCPRCDKMTPDETGVHVDGWDVYTDVYVCPKCAEKEDEN